MPLKKDKVDVQTIFVSEGAGSYIYHHLNQSLVHLSGESQGMSVQDAFKKMQYDKLFCKLKGIPYLVMQKIPSHIERDKLSSKGEDSA